MTTRRKVSFAAFSVAACFVISALLIGCDFSRDEPVEVTTEEVLSALYAAETEAAAVAAIAKLEQKTGLSADANVSLYRAQALTGEQRAALAARLTAFNGSRNAAVESYAQVFRRAVDGGMTITADFEPTLAVFAEVVSDALVDPEDPNFAFVLAAGVGGPKLPKPAPVDAAALDDMGRHPVSPIQADFFTIWLARHGAFMDVHSGRKIAGPEHPASECPTAAPGTCPGMAMKAQVCHKPGTPAQKTLCVPLPAVPAHIRHGDTCGPCHDQGGGG